jgi:hypothetical protein
MAHQYRHPYWLKTWLAIEPLSLADRKSVCSSLMLAFWDWWFTASRQQTNGRHGACSLPQTSRTPYEPEFERHQDRKQELKAMLCELQARVALGQKRKTARLRYTHTSDSMR